MQQLLWARRVHGGAAVLVERDGNHVVYTHGGVRYPTGRALLTALYQRGGTPAPLTARIPRYFKLKAPVGTPASGCVLSLFGTPGPLPASLMLAAPVVVKGCAGVTLSPSVVMPARKPRAPLVVGTVLELFVVKPSARRVAPLVGRQRRSRRYGLLPGGGIDLALRGIEVRRILYKCFGGKLAAGGHDPEEVLGEVYKGLLVRNNGKCPWDPAKSSFGHYVYMVCQGVLVNYHQKCVRRRRHESPGLRVAANGGSAYVDVAAADTSLVVADKRTDMAEYGRLLDGCAEYVSAVVGFSVAFCHQVLSLLAAGYKRASVARQLQCSAARCNKVWQAAKGYFGLSVQPSF